VLWPDAYGRPICPSVRALSVPRLQHSSMARQCFATSGVGNKVYASLRNLTTVARVSIGRRSKTSFKIGSRLHSNQAELNQGGHG